MPPAEKKSSTKERDATIRHGFGRFRGIGHQTKQGKSEVSNQRKTGQGIGSQGLKIVVKK